MILNKSEIKGLIDKHLYEGLSKGCYEVKSIPAINFLTGSRFDLAFKLIYLDMLYKDSSFAKELYKEHIRAFSFGRFDEPGNDTKNTIDRFYEDFKKTFENIRTKGFDGSKTLIPLSKDGNILNGAHRVASAIVLNKNVSCVELNLPCFNNDYKYFYDRNVPIEILDIAATKFIEYANNIHIALVWPAAQGHDQEVENIIPNIVYRKNVELTQNGAHNLLSQLYMGEEWFGNSENNFAGINSKMAECFRHKGPVRVVVFQAESLDESLIIKDKIREVFNIGKHSIHITDRKEEAIDLSRSVFNDNSIHFLNNTKLNKYLSLHSDIEKINTSILVSNLDKSNIVLGGELTLVAYGIKNISDVNPLVSFDRKNNFYEAEVSFDENPLFYNENEANFIYNPLNFFYFKGIKFISYDLVLEIKENSTEEEDLNDIITMKKYIKSNKNKLFLSRLKQNFNYEKLKLENRLIRLLKDSGRYEDVRVVYRFLRRK